MSEPAAHTWALCQHPNPTIRELAHRILKLEEKVLRMAKKTDDEFEALRKRLDDATTAIGQRLDKLAGSIEGGLTAEEATPIFNELTALADKLESMGKDPENPDPTPMPQPAPNT